MAAMGAGDHVTVGQVIADAGRDGFLADIEMDRARQVAGGRVVAEPLLHLADKQHALIQRQERVVARPEIRTIIHI